MTRGERRLELARDHLGLGRYEGRHYGVVMPATEALIMPRINAMSVADRAELKASVDWAEEYETHERKHWL